MEEIGATPVTLVRIEASRYNAGGACLLYFNGEYSRFDLLSDGKHTWQITRQSEREFLYE